MKKVGLIVLFIANLACFPAMAQTAEQEVEAVIRSLFDGMRQKNATRVADAFYT